jgi:hypothetical protein
MVIMETLMGTGDNRALNASPLGPLCAVPADTMDNTATAKNMDVAAQPGRFVMFFLSAHKLGYT